MVTESFYVFFKITDNNKFTSAIKDNFKIKLKVLHVLKWCFNLIKETLQLFFVLYGSVVSVCSAVFCCVPYSSTPGFIVCFTFWPISYNINN